MKILFKVFQKPTALEVAQRDLAEAQVQALKHEQASEYHRRLTQYYQDTAKRLETYVRNADVTA